MVVPNQNAKVEDYYGYWQPYPSNIRNRRRFQQLEAVKRGGSFCARIIAGFAVAYHIAYYTYQFTRVNPECRRDLDYVIWLKQKLPLLASVTVPSRGER